MRVVFLYTELAEYFIRCCEELSLRVEVHIVRWPVNPEAPFRFHFPPQLRIYDKEQYNRSQLKELVRQINPDILICSGWIDKDYLAVSADHAGRIPTVMTCDTHWKGSLKQRLAAILSRFYLLPRFSHAWVPGEIQKQYALKLGFRTEKIRLGFYSCDLQKFNEAYSRRSGHAFPKRFLYVGRYYDFKGVGDLWEAFALFDKENRNGWELWCLGTGDLPPVQHPRIRHFGFVQPSELEPIIAACSVFVLPSRFEPWGVVVHEFAASGFPMILSSEVGAASAFLRTGQNGFVFKAGSVEALHASLKKIADLSENELISMSVKSHELAQAISPASWADVVSGILYEKKEK